MAQDSENSGGHPSKNILSFFRSLQIAIEATYIPPTVHTNPRSVQHSATNELHPKGFQLHLPTAPPQTPSPVPASTEGDKKYIHADGTLLKSFIWGEEGADPLETFRFLWSESEKCWFGVYRVILQVGVLWWYTRIMHCLLIA